MDLEIIFVFGLFFFTVISFIWEKIPSDLTAILTFTAILIAGFFGEQLPKVDELLNVFSNPAPMTIAAMFTISAALQKCGIIDQLAKLLGKLSCLGYRLFLLIMILFVALISAFINNTPVVIILLPVVLSLSRKLNTPASKMLIPLSYASIFGGTCTLVGTSTNILASVKLAESGQPPIAMFELAAVALPLLFLGTLYLVTIGHKMIPARESFMALLSDEERKEYIAEALVRKGSQIVGITLEETGLLEEKGIRVLEIIRKDIVLRKNPKQKILKEGDLIVFACRPSGIAHARSFSGLKWVNESGLGLEAIAAHEGSVIEGIIGSKSSLIGKTLHQVHFSRRYRMTVLAIHRRGENIRERTDTIELQFGDTLLMMGTDRAIETLRGEKDILLLDQAAKTSKKNRQKAPWVISILIGIITLNTFTPVPIEAAAIIGCALIFLTGSLRPKEAYDSIEWSILIIIYGMLGFGMAMDKTGAAHLIAEKMTALAENFFAVPWQPFVLLATLYLCTMIMTEFLSNNATIVLMAPIAVSLAATMGLDARPFIITACIASSASFSTPIGYQTNTYIYGVGGYKFTDFCKVGIPLNVIYFLGCVLIVPLIWPLS